MNSERQDEFLTNRQLCERLGINPRTSLRWRLSGDGPKFVRAGKQIVLYRRSDIEAWEQSRTFRHRAEEATAPRAA